MVSIKTLGIIAIASFTTLSCNQTGKPEHNDEPVIENQVSQEAQNAEKFNGLNFLKELNGKYPSETTLMRDSVFTGRLKALLGERYKFFKNNWAVEVPMSFENDIFSATACQRHNCSETNFIVVYDFSQNIMYAGIREKGEVKTYAEKGEDAAKITEWAQQKQ